MTEKRKNVRELIANLVVLCALLSEVRLTMLSTSTTRDRLLRTLVEIVPRLCRTKHLDTARFADNPLMGAELLGLIGQNRCESLHDRNVRLTCSI